MKLQSVYISSTLFKSICLNGQYSCCSLLRIWQLQYVLQLPQGTTQLNWSV